MTTLTLEQHEEIYNTIISFYDVAEELINTVQDQRVKNPEMQLEFVEPLVLQIEEGTDVLAEEYRNFVKTHKKPGIFGRKRIEKAMAQIYSALEACHEVLHTEPLLAAQE